MNDLIRVINRNPKQKKFKTHLISKIFSLEKSRDLLFLFNEFVQIKFFNLTKQIKKE